MTVYAGLYGPEALIEDGARLITAAVIDVFQHGTTTHVSLYQDNARATPLSNPVPGGVDGSTAGRGLDTHGNLSFYVDPGRYDLRIATGIGTRTIQIEVQPDPGEGSAAYAALGAPNVLTNAIGSSGSMFKVNQYATGAGNYVFESLQWPGAESSFVGHNYSNNPVGQWDNTGHGSLHVHRATENQTNNPGSTGTGAYHEYQSYTPTAFTDGVSNNASTTYTSSTAAFVAGDVGRLIAGKNIPYGTYIASVTNGTTVVLSQAANGTGTGLTFTLSRGTVGVLAQFDPLHQWVNYAPQAVPFTFATAAGTTGPSLVLAQAGSGNFLNFTDWFTTTYGAIQKGPNAGLEISGPAGSSFVTFDNTNGTRLGYVNSGVTVSFGTVQVGLTGDAIGFSGKTPVATPTAAAAATDAATTQTLANSLRTILINVGLAA